jgi:predicted nuclease of restriction endonuclease-like (RecB) superfamily
MARKKTTPPKARTTPSARSGRPSPERREPAVDVSPASYAALLDDVKGRIRTAQVKAALAVNHELISLYWGIGQSIGERQRAEGWGKSVVDRLAVDLQKEFPGESGYSASNLWRMRSFYLAYTKEVIILAQPVREIRSTTQTEPPGKMAAPNLAQPVREPDGKNLPHALAQIPWGHNITLIEKLKDTAERIWYARQTTEQGWSRAVLVHQIETDLYRRQGRALTNFERTLPAPDSDLARQALRIRTASDS